MFVWGHCTVPLPQLDFCHRFDGNGSLLSYKQFFEEKPGAKQCSPFIKTINLETKFDFACILGIDVFGTKV